MSELKTKRRECRLGENEENGETERYAEWLNKSVAIHKAVAVKA
jgi:hypothetical protein